MGPSGSTIFLCIAWEFWNICDLTQWKDLYLNHSISICIALFWWVTKTFNLIMHPISYIDCGFWVNWKLDTRKVSSVCLGKEWGKTTTMLQSTIKKTLRNFVFRDVKIKHKTWVPKRKFWAHSLANSTRF